MLGRGAMGAHGCGGHGNGTARRAVTGGTCRLKGRTFLSSRLRAALCSAARVDQEPLRCLPRWILGPQRHLQIPSQ
jgi:hypothetical protein